MPIRRLCVFRASVQDGFITSHNRGIVIADTDPAALPARVLEPAPHEPRVLTLRDV